MEAAKETVRGVLDRLPDDCSLDDIIYHLYVVSRIQRGLDDSQTGATVPHAQAMQELRQRWLSKSAK